MFLKLQPLSIFQEDELLGKSGKSFKHGQIWHR